MLQRISHLNHLNLTHFPQQRYLRISSNNDDFPNPVGKTSKTPLLGNKFAIPSHCSALNLSSPSNGSLWLRLDRSLSPTFQPTKKHPPQTLLSRSSRHQTRSTLLATFHKLTFSIFRNQSSSAIFKNPYEVLRSQSAFWSTF